MSIPTYIGFLLPFHYLNAKLTKTLHHSFIKLKFLQAFKHLIDALFLLFHIRMHIEVEGRADIRMTKNDANGLVVTLAFNASCGK